MNEIGQWGNEAAPAARTRRASLRAPQRVRAGVGPASIEE